MPKLTVLVDVNDADVIAIGLDKAANLFSAQTDEEYLSVRLMERIEAMTQLYVYGPEEQAAVNAIREARKKPPQGVGEISVQGSK